MTKIKLIIGTYNCEPPGSTSDQLEKKYQNSYKPFLKVLYEYPKIRASLHYSGILFEWFEQKHPEILLLVNEMIKRRQIEIIGGGFYSPVLSLIPAKDRVNQIELLTTYIRKKFGRRPRGFWLNEFIWEPFLCSSLHSSGMKYTFLEDTQFKRAGIENGDIYEPCYTEDQGKTITVLPVHSKLLKTAQEHSPEEFINLLMEIKQENENSHISLMFDGSRMNCKSKDLKAISCKWLDQFFNLLSDPYRSSFTLTRAGDFIKTLSVLKKVYFPVSSGDKIDFQALSTEKQNEWIHGKGRHNHKKSTVECSYGYFRQFLTKYDESSYLYSKMLFTHTLVSQMKSDKSRKRSAGEEILKSQTHYPYWHGKYVGFYDPHLRQHAYQSLINAEKNIREKGNFSTNLQSFDFDMDGREEYLYRGQYINVYVHGRGGRIFELDYLVTPWNYLNTIKRYPESYHSQEKLKYNTDTYFRDAFLDHFLSVPTEELDFKTGKYVEKGDFLDGLYNLLELDREHKEFTLFREGTVADRKVRIEKKYNFKKNYIEVTYRVTNQEKSKDLSIIFGNELNFSFYSAETNTITEKYEKKNEPVFNDIAIHDTKNKVLLSINSSSGFNLWEFPVYSSTNDSGNTKELYQYNSYLLRWELNVPSLAVWENTVTIKLEKR